MEQQFVGVSGAQPTIFSAPGRVNLIGEHTDYNDGFVMPCAIGLRTHVSVSPRLERKLLIQSEGFPQSFEFDLDELPQRANGAWCDYVLGIAVALQHAGHALRHPAGASDRQGRAPAAQRSWHRPGHRRRWSHTSRGP